MKYVFDIDGTLTLPNPTKSYSISQPDIEAITEVNRLFDEGHSITLFTARGAGSGIDWHDLTVQQIKKWGIKYHNLIDKGKPSWDVFVDDKAINSKEWKKSFKKKKTGFVASTFDLLHAGHCLMLKDAKNHCDWLIAGLQTDPTSDRPNKNKPVMSIEERYIILLSNRYVDAVQIYNTEKDLYEILKVIKPDIRILGSDYIGREDEITGSEFCKEIYFHKRGVWSTSELRERIKKVNEKNCISI